MAIYELEDKDGCPDCHHGVPLYLGYSGILHDTGNGELLLAYRCPNCGMETYDFTVGADDILPAKLAWSREEDGQVTWYLEERAEQSVHPTKGGQS